MGEIDYKGFVSKVKRTFSDQDITFSIRVFSDVLNFLDKDGPEGLRILTFPPLDSQWRYLIHKVSERYNLKSYAVGEGVRRLTMVMKPERLLAEQSALRKKNAMERKCEREKNSGEDSGLSTSKTVASSVSVDTKKEGQLEHIQTSEFIIIDKNISKKSNDKKKTPEKRSKKTKGLTFSLTSGIGYNLESNSTPKNFYNIIPPRLNAKASEFVPTNTVDDAPRFRHVPYYPQFESCPRYQQYEDMNVYPLDNTKSHREEIFYFQTFSVEPPDKNVVVQQSTEAKNTGAIPKRKTGQDDNISSDIDKNDNRNDPNHNVNETYTIDINTNDASGDVQVNGNHVPININSQLDKFKTFTIDTSSSDNIACINDTADHQTDNSTDVGIAQIENPVHNTEKINKKLSSDNKKIPSSSTEVDKAIAVASNDVCIAEKSNSRVPAVYNNAEASGGVSIVQMNMNNMPIAHMNAVVPIPGMNHFPINTGVRMGVSMAHLNNAHIAQMNVGLPILPGVRMDGNPMNYANVNLAQIENANKNGQMVDQGIIPPYYANDMGQAKNYPVMDYIQPFYDDLHYSNIAYYHEETMPMSFYDDEGRKIIHFPTDVPDEVKLKDKNYDGKKYIKFGPKMTSEEDNISKKYAEFYAKVKEIEKEDQQSSNSYEDEYEKISNPEYDSSSDSSYSTNSEFYGTPVPNLNLSKLSNETLATTMPVSNVTINKTSGIKAKTKQSVNGAIKRTCLNFAKPEKVVKNVQTSDHLAQSPTPLPRSPSPVARTANYSCNVDCGDPEVMVTFRPFRNQNSGYGDQINSNPNETGSCKTGARKKCCRCDCHERSESQAECNGQNVPGLTLHIFWEPNYLKKN